LLSDSSVAHVFQGVVFRRQLLKPGDHAFVWNGLSFSVYYESDPYTLDHG
jgi:hypothetical protein